MLDAILKLSDSIKETLADELIFHGDLLDPDYTYEDLDLGITLL